MSVLVKLIFWLELFQKLIDQKSKMSKVKFMNIQVFEIDRIDHVTLGHMTFSFMTKTDKKRHFTYHIKSQVQLLKKMFRSECGFQTGKFMHIIKLYFPHFSASLNSSSGNSHCTFNSRGISIKAFLYLKMVIEWLSKEQFEVKMISIYLRVDLCHCFADSENTYCKVNDMIINIFRTWLLYDITFILVKNLTKISRIIIFWAWK